MLYQAEENLAARDEVGIHSIHVAPFSHVSRFTLLTRIIHDGSSRNRAVATRDRRAEPRGRETYLKQYVDRLSGEPARHQACRSGVSAAVVETFVNNAGELSVR